MASWAMALTTLMASLPMSVFLTSPIPWFASMQNRLYLPDLHIGRAPAYH